MKLGENECDYELAHFLQHGEFPPVIRNGKKYHVLWNDYENELYREYQESNWYEYFDPAKTYRYCLFK